MGMNASLIAIGPWNRSILLNDQRIFDYDKSRYTHIKNGTQIAVTLVVCEGTSSSCALAECFGISENDLSKHVMPAGLFVDNWPDFSPVCEYFWYKDLVMAFNVFQAYNWTFIYLPNG